jgi:RimJ/RimL family protein N-acetyltransferase
MTPASPMMVEPVTLTGRCVRLEPLTIEHVSDLTRVGLDAELWRWIPTAVTNETEMRAYVAIALEERARGAAMPYAVIDLATEQAIGSTRYAAIVPEHRRLEIGWTWYAPAFQRTAANTETKLLLMTHAFETLGANRVEFKTDSLNEKSRNALTRIGAREEGTFRDHMITASGRLRHSVYFSIIAPEWPAVKSRLKDMLQR